MPHGTYNKQNRAAEDRIQVKDLKRFKYFAVFDGHGGAHKNINHVVDYCQQNLHIKLTKNLSNIHNEDEIIKIIKQTFVELDEEMFEFGMKYGSTCTLVLIDKYNNKIYQVNLGDSKTIIYDNYNDDIYYTIGHNVENDENKLINEGASIINGRLYGALLPTKGFGNYLFKLIDNNHNFYQKVLDGEIKTNTQSVDKILDQFDLTIDCENQPFNVIPDVNIFDEIDRYDILLLSDAVDEVGYTEYELVEMLIDYKKNFNAKAIANKIGKDISQEASDDTSVIVIIQ